MPKVREFLKKLHAPTWLGILIAVVLILRIPSFFEPYYYGDEMIYLTLGQGIRQGIPLYSGLHDNKPPLIYLLAAVAGNLFWFKVILAAFNVASIIFFWKLAQALFPQKDRLQRISTIVFGLATTLPLLEGNTVNAELLMVLPILVAFWMVFAKKNLFWAGVMFGLASLFKIPAAFEFPVIIVFWLLISKFDLKKAAVLTTGFVSPLVLSFLWFFLHGAGGQYITAAFLQNLGYVSSWRQGVQRQGNFFANNLPLFIRGMIVLVGSGLLFLFRRKLSKQFIFLCLWLLFSLFAVTLSERPYPHYLIQALPAFSFLAGTLVADKTLEQSLTVIPLALFFLVPNYFHFWTYPTRAYYGRFLAYVGGKYSRQEYFSLFDPKVNNNYRIAEFVSSSTKPAEKIFVWGGDSPTIYALARRLPPIKYVADYHILDYSSESIVATELGRNEPKLIIFLPHAHPFPELRALVAKKYLLIDNANRAEIWLKSK